MIDQTTKSVPDFQKITATTRRAISKEEYENCVNQFPLLLQVHYEEGHLTDPVMEVHGIAVDVNSKGERVHREAGISQEAYQQSKCISHKSQHSYRQQRLDEISAREQEEIAEAEVTKSLIRVRNEECEKLLLAAADTSDLSLVEIDIFGKPLKTQLKAFYSARKEGTPEGGWPNKGSVAEAKSGKINMIKLAFDCCSLPVLPSPREQQAPEERHPSVAAAEEGIACETAVAAPLSLGQCIFRLTKESIAELKGSLDPLQAHDIDDERDLSSLQMEVDLLTKLLWARLERHIKKRVTDAKKHSHWVWNFARLNISCVAAVMVLKGHARKNLEGIVDRGQVCLLRPPGAGGKFVPLSKSSEMASKLQGCYLYFDPEQGNWIRSGEVSGRPFQERLKEHEARSKLRDEKDVESKFYTSYPSKDTQIDVSKTKIGDFEDLVAYCGIGFDGTSSVDKLLRLFNWGDEMMQRRLSQLHWKGKSEELKQVHMLGYLFELMYDLAIAPATNVSRSPGFETPLNIYPNKRAKKGSQAGEEHGAP